MNHSIDASMEVDGARRVGAALRVLSWPLASKLVEAMALECAKVFD